MLEGRLGATRTLAKSASRDCPQRGVYFFFEPGEQRSGSGDGARVVRVGTHALKPGSNTKLWTRLSQHRGALRSGGGNHRGSIFRLLVGSALIARDGLSCPTWDTQRSNAPSPVRAAEVEMERLVSRSIGAMPVLWLSVDDDPGAESERGVIERGAIALLSGWGQAGIDPPSVNWLGHACTRDKVRRSGLWNNNHVDEAYDPRFLDVMERRVLETPCA
ncbi:hypothetical protein GLS40_08025 [Pseudooceanicola sp. 216_PA32_1]|uniref:GIY-YIG domain-containing protein n=2 Tax=Pseudooceanicola pacificus TaxID=2676438 RepID=A0A844W1H0_9RHOB|nr:hypothetical protein [Pseudooceanicola pacificus]